MQRLRRADCELLPAEVKPEVLDGVLTRLKEFVQPFAACLDHQARRDHLEEYVAGLVSNVKRKNIETIAYLHEQDRQPLQQFIGQKDWAWQPMIRSWLAKSARRWETAVAYWPSIPPGRQARQGVGGRGAAVVWTGGQGRQLPSRCVHGLHHPQGTYVG